jgi:hypothetical protein
MMMKYISLASIVSMTASAVLLSGAANAVTFSGYDTNPTNNTRLSYDPNSNSQIKFNDFSANLNGIGVTTESFEDTTNPNTTIVGNSISGLVRSISGTTATFSYTTKATLGNPSVPVTGGSTTQVQKKTSGVTANGTYPTDGDNFISINSANNFSISFSNTLAAFGYFGSDLGDSGNVLTMQFFNGSNPVAVSSQTVDAGTGSANSSKFFFGFIADDSAQYFDRVVFSSNSAGDAIGIDQIKIGTSAQLTTAVPEPSSMLGILLFGGSVVMLKRRQKLARSRIKY